jgi:Zn-dependent peptidase ImmA (M78 family)
VREDDCHFRKLFTAPRAVMAQAAARGTLVEMLVTALEKRLRLPRVDFPDLGKPGKLEEVERVAEAARQHWRLGADGPITNMTRVLENAGAVVMHFADISERIDALSIARRRPIIVRSDAKAAAVRLRFDLAHECGHLVMHQGVITGDHETEEQAHRFASAFLLPARALAREFPRGRTLQWNALYSMKLRWKVSVRAIVRRALDLGLIDAAQYRTANVHLTKTGQSKAERHDETLEAERAELVDAALDALASGDGEALRELVRDLGVAPAMFDAVFGRAVQPAAEREGAGPLLRLAASGATSVR